MLRRSPIVSGLEDHRAAERARVDRVGLLLAALATALLGVVLARVVMLQFAPSARLVAAGGQHISTERFDAPRGDIVDRRGRMIAGSRVGDRVFFDPVMFPVDADLGRRIALIGEAIGADPDALAARMMDAIGRSVDEFHRTGRFGRYTLLSDALPEERADAVRALQIQGVHLEPIPIRERMGDDTLASIVGRLGVDAEHTLGFERRFEDRLAPRAGSIEVMRDGRRRTMWAMRDGIHPASPGAPVRASIDLRIQQIAREELARAVRECDAAGGRCVIVDPSTGEVLAMVDIVEQRDDLVAFDAKNPAHVNPASGQRPRFRIIPSVGDPDLDPAVRRNRLVHDQYEPGSIFKPFVWGAATTRRVARLDEMFTVNYGSWRTAYGRPIRDVVDTAKELSWRNVLVRSSNIGMAQAAARMDKRELRRTIEAYGFGSPTGIGISGERSGMVTPERRWSDYTQTSVSFGQEIAVTPVQMLRAFCAFARSGEQAGTLPELTLVARDDTGVPPAESEPVLDAWTVYQTRDAMGEIAVNVQRRARQLDAEEPASLYTSFGKTGTAQVARPGTRGYFERQYISSYICAAPIENPRIALLITIDDPGPDRIAREAHYGSATAGPAALRTIDRVLSYLGVPPDVESGGGGRLATR
ncbi:MAG: peptidoglycan D,D-transpeptidase FtsI family protein [Phycisphaerales bacterium]